METFASLQEFRRSARLWLAAHAPLKQTRVDWGVGDFTAAIFHDLTEDEEAAAYKAACDWHRTKLDAGWASLSWPEKFGGRGLPASYEHAFAAEEARFEVPVPPEAVMITLFLAAPTIAVFGTAEQQATLVPSFLRADRLCCQLFSEPDAGSDLASISCTAERHGDQWIINGQKVWTSGARHSDYGFLIARSDRVAPKREGLTAFLLPLDSDGVEVSPIRQMTGGSSFNEVFLHDVRVLDSSRLGREGEGWKVALTMLGFERAISGEGAGGVGGSWDQVLALAHHLGATSSPVVRQDLAQLYIRSRVLELTNERAQAAPTVGSQTGPAGSVCKLFWTETLTAISAVVTRLLAARMMADSGEWGTYGWNEHLLGAPGYRIAGGSDEIQRNIIGERVLGLPREPLVDRVGQSLRNAPSGRS